MQQRGRPLAAAPKLNWALWDQHRVGSLLGSKVAGTAEHPWQFHYIDQCFAKIIVLERTQQELRGLKIASIQNERCSYLTKLVSSKRRRLETDAEPLPLRLNFQPDVMGG